MTHFLIQSVGWIDILNLFCIKHGLLIEQDIATSLGLAQIDTLLLTKYHYYVCFNSKGDVRHKYS